jgi:predicted nucleic acid-binding Zn ribbon protein
MPQDYYDDEDGDEDAAQQNGHKSLDKAAERAVKQLEQSYQDGSRGGGTGGGDRKLFTGKFDSRKAHLMRVHSEDEYSGSGGSCSSSTTAHSRSSFSDQFVEGLFSSETLPPGGYDELVQGQEAYYDNDEDDDGDVSSANASEYTDVSCEDEPSSGLVGPAAVDGGAAAMANNDENGSSEPAGNDGRTMSVKPNDDPTYLKEARYSGADSGVDPDQVVHNVLIDRKPDADNEEEKTDVLSENGDDENRRGITSRDGNKDLEANDEDKQGNDHENEKEGKDDENDEKKDDEKTQEELEEEQSRRRRRRCIWLLLCLLCCLLILLISLISYWVNRDEEIAPTMAPTQAVSR